jgi:hypothetical protein
LLAWWYSTLASRWRARAFAVVWLVVVAGGAVLITLDTPRFNSTTDLRELKAVLARAPAPLFAFDLQDLALSFNLDRPVVNDKNYQTFESRARRGEMGYLIVSDRALRAAHVAPCMRRIANGVVTGRSFTVLDPTDCTYGVSSETQPWLPSPLKWYSASSG